MGVIQLKNYYLQLLLFGWNKISKNINASFTAAIRYIVIIQGVIHLLLKSNVQLYNRFLIGILQQTKLRISATRYLSCLVLVSSIGVETLRHRAAKWGRSPASMLHTTPSCIVPSYAVLTMCCNAFRTNCALEATPEESDVPGLFHCALYQCFDAWRASLC